MFAIPQKSAQQEPVQLTVAGDVLRLAADLLPSASEAEIQELCNRIDSLTLADLMRKRADVEKLIELQKAGVLTLDKRWCELQRGITTLVARGVQP
jgi:hypothetical protein